MQALFLLAALCALSAGGPAIAGAALTLEQTVNGEGAEPETMYLESDRLRIQSSGSDAIFRADLNKVWFLRSQSHEYIEMTPEGITQMRDRVAQARDRMPPPGVAQGSTENAHRIAYQKAGAPRQVGDWTCIPYHLVMDGEPISDLCIAKLLDLGLTRDDVSTFDAFTAFMSPLSAASGGDSPPSPFGLDEMKKDIGFDGFPVQTSLKSPDGTLTLQTTLRSIRHEDAPPGSFDLPPGYIRRDPASMGAPNPSE